MTSKAPASANVLFSTYTHPTYMPPLQLSERQIIVGPHYPTRIEDGVVRSLNVGLGSYDLAQLIAGLPADQTPDLVVAQYDSYENCAPRNLAGAPGRKLLLIADTHHGAAPLQTVLTYARAEPFDRIALIHDPHHLHWFAEAGLGEVAYIPNVNVEAFEAPDPDERRPTIMFVGQVGSQHPRRRFMLETIRAAGLPLETHLASPAEAAGLYGDAQISFNCSLNGDLNMRVFEVLAAGGFLVTDRLSPQAGLEALFRPGEHYVDYEDEKDLVEKLRFYLARPHLCLQIARAGRQAYRDAHAPARRVRDVLEFAFGASAPTPIDARAAPAGEGFGENLVQRMGLYEMLQGLCLERERLVVAVDAAVGARTISDLVDLRPLDVCVLADPVAVSALKGALQGLGMVGQVRLSERLTNDWNLLVLDAGAMGRLDEVDASCGAPIAVMNEQGLSPEDRARLSAKGYAAIGDRDWLFGRQGRG